MMPLIYDKLFELLKNNGYNMTRIRKENILGQRTITAIKHGTGGIDHRTIEKLCSMFNCQPNDLMEYIPKKTFPGPGQFTPESMTRIPTQIPPEMTREDDEKDLNYYKNMINDRKKDS